MKTAVISGASSGIGLSTAKMLIDEGYMVFDFSRTGNDDFGINHIKVDVTNESEVIDGINTVIAKTGRIDLLITCAGMGVSGAVEFIDEIDMRKQFDVNLFGTINLVKNVLPHMREVKSGRIICISSVAGVYSIPFQTYYSSSKAAINSFVDAISNEVKQFNIDICAIMPGDIKTGFTKARKKNIVGNDIYNGVIEKSVSKMESDELNGMNPDSVAKFVAKITKKSHISQRYTVGLSYKLLVFLQRLLPHKVVVWIIGKLY